MKNISPTIAGIGLAIAVLVVGRMDSDEANVRLVAREQNHQEQRIARLNEADKSLRYMTSYDRIATK